MAIIHRRIFYGKVGTSDQLVKHMQEVNALAARHGTDWKAPVMTDYLNGRSDRVVVEYELEEVSQFDTDLETMMRIPEVASFMGPWMETLNNLIHYAEAENWKVN